MIVSVNWLKKYVDIDMPIDELVTLIGAQLVEVESTEDLSEKYKDVIIARVVSSEKMESSDHLNVVRIDDGGVVDNVERGEDGYVQVVCGAPNVRAEMLVAWLPPASVVPETFNTSEPFTLSARPLRGFMSNGMIASARELDLYDEHDGILEVDKPVSPGSSFAEIYELNDTLIDIENKSLTHRPDAFGIVGLAREIAGIQGKQFNTPQWLQDVGAVVDPKAEVEAPKISIESAELSRRFQLVVFDDISESAQSNVQIQTYLARSGVRPINAVVDISNYLMLLTGQPTHMYDYDKLRAVAGDDFTVGVRCAREGEKLTLLDGKNAQLDVSDIVITAGDTPVGLAGIMGGQSTAVDATTKRTVLEVATFDLYHMRSTQMRHGVFSEAVTRYTKGIPAELGRPVLVEAARMVEEVTGALTASQVVDEYPGQQDSKTVNVTSSHVNALLGTQFSAQDITELLENVEFSVTFQGLEGVVTVPYWRNDIAIAEDVIEEIGRLAGFDTINATLPLRDFTAVHPERIDTLRSVLRTSLAAAGLNEVLTYSFVHGDLLKRVGQDPRNSYRIINSISPDLQYYRQSLQPSLLQHIYPNIRLGYTELGLFEINKVHSKEFGLNDESVPIEGISLSAVIAHAKRTEGAAYYQAKYVLERLLGAVGLTPRYEELSSVAAADLSPQESVFEPKRSARIFLPDGTALGAIGEYKSGIAKSFKLPVYSAGFELSVETLVAHAPTLSVVYTPPSRYPSVERDMSIKVAANVPYAAVIGAVETALESADVETRIEPVAMYAPESSETKNITVRITCTSHYKTLTSEEVSQLVSSVEAHIGEVVKGEVI